MATLLLTAVGTLFGGPIGGAIGAFVGRQADQLIFRPGPRQGPRLKELTVTTSSYGQPIPRIFGRMRVGGTIIWSTDLIESSRKESSGKGQPSVKTYSYSASFAVALSSTPIDRVGRIWADGNLLRGAGGDLKAEGAMRIYRGTGDAQVDPVIAADRAGNVPAFRDCAYVVFEGLQLADFGNRIPTLTFEVFAPQDTTVSLAQIVPASANGSDNLVLRDLRGFSDEGGAVGSSLAAIDQVYPLSCVTRADGLNLTSASAMPSEIPVLPAQLSRRDSEDAEERHKRRGGLFGREPMALRYYDEDRDYQPGVQRAVGMRPDGKETMIDLPATMTSVGARRLANTNAHRTRWQDETVTWRIGELDPAIGPGSVVRLPQASGFWRVRSWEWFDGGIELGLARIAPELGTVIAAETGTSNKPIDVISTPTLLDVFEVPADESGNPANPVILAAPSSSGAGWRGAALFVEQGGSLVELGSSGSARAVIGSLAHDLGPSPGIVIEPNASLEIELIAPDLTLAGTDITGLALGMNRMVIGGEVLQFLNAEPLSATLWKLTGLLRGRAGTEDAAMLGHQAGATAVLLNDNLTALDPTLVPSEPGVRIAALGQSDAEPVFAELRNAGLSRRPLVPVAARVSERMDGSWELCWTRRARGQWRWPTSSDVPLVEESQSYLVGFGPVEAPLRAWQTGDPYFVLSAPERAGIVAELGPGHLWVKQQGTFAQSRALMLATLA